MRNYILTGVTAQQTIKFTLVCPKCALSSLLAVTYFAQNSTGRIRKALVGAADGVQQIAVTLQDKVRSGKSKLAYSG